jgi:hypothetical protein
MSDTIDAPGWTRKDGKLHLSGYDDVTVSYEASTLSGAPFIGLVGAVRYEHLYVEDALDWAERVAAGRKLMTTDGPLPASPEADEETPSQPYYVNNRGLRL